MNTVYNNNKKYLKNDENLELPNKNYDIEMRKSKSKFDIHKNENNGYSESPKGLQHKPFKEQNDFQSKMKQKARKDQIKDSQEELQENILLKKTSLMTIPLKPQQLSIFEKNYLFLKERTIDDLNMLKVLPYISKRKDIPQKMSRNNNNSKKKKLNIYEMPFLNEIHNQLQRPNVSPFEKEIKLLKNVRFPQSRSIKLESENFNNLKNLNFNNDAKLSQVYLTKKNIQEISKSPFFPRITNDNSEHLNKSFKIHAKNLKDIGQTSIKIHHKNFNLDCLINTFFNLINTFINNTYKNKFYNTDYNLIIKSAKSLGINLRPSHVKTGLIRYKEFEVSVKEKLLRLMYIVINGENNISPELPPIKPGYYKAYVGEGNNSSLIKSILKRR